MRCLRRAQSDERGVSASRLEKVTRLGHLPPCPPTQSSLGRALRRAEWRPCQRYRNRTTAQKPGPRSASSAHRESATLGPPAVPPSERSCRPAQLHPCRKDEASWRPCRSTAVSCALVELAADTLTWSSLPRRCHFSRDRCLAVRCGRCDCTAAQALISAASPRAPPPAVCAPLPSAAKVPAAPWPPKEVCASVFRLAHWYIRRAWFSVVQWGSAPRRFRFNDARSERKGGV